MLDDVSRVFCISHLCGQRVSVIGAPATTVVVDEKPGGIEFFIADAVGFDDGVAESGGNGVGRTAPERHLVVDGWTLGA